MNKPLPNHLLVLLLTLFCPLGAHAQGQISGHVADGKGGAIADAIVRLATVNDSLLQTAYTDQDGRYNFQDIGKGQYKVGASTMGGETQWKKALIWDGSKVSLDFTLDDAVQLSGVEVRANGITHSGDTTSYVVGHFTTGSESNLKDVLGRLPGIQVDKQSGTVSANGKRVSRILLENQDLFQGNTCVPLDNLSARGISRVDIIDNYTEYDIYNGFQASNETVLNVGMADSMKNRVTGDLTAYGGLRSKYLVKNSSLRIGKGWMMSAVVSSNNTGERLLSFQDLVQYSGGMANLLRGDDPEESIKKKIEEFSAFISNRNDVHKSSNSLLSLNIIAMPSRKVKLSLGGIYNYSDTRSHSETDFSYQTGYRYREDNDETTRAHMATTNLKVEYQPRKDLAVVAGGQFTLARYKTRSNLLTSTAQQKVLDRPRTFSGSGDLQLTKRWGDDLLTVYAQYQTSDLHSRYGYTAPDTLAQPMNLSSAYSRKQELDKDELSASATYLKRLGKSYYLRFGSSYRHQKQTLDAWLEEQENRLFNNCNLLQYNSAQGDAALVKDAGKLTFDARLRYIYLHANSRKAVSDRSRNYFSPMAWLKYSITPFHYLSLRYDDKPQTASVNDFFDGYLIQSYRSLSHSSLESLFSHSRKLSLSHIWMMQYIGLNIVNTVSLDNVSDAPVYNYSQEGYMTLTDTYGNGHKRSWQLMTAIEYKLLWLPLNLRYVVNYGHTTQPVYMEEQAYSSALRTFSSYLNASTHYKKGFNADATWQYLYTQSRGLPTVNGIISNIFNAALSWQNKRAYAAVNAEYRLNTVNGDRANFALYGFEFRYNLSKNLTLQLRGNDVFHLRHHRQTSNSVTAFYVADSRVDYMPGHILVGLKLKY